MNQQASTEGLIDVVMSCYQESPEWFEKALDSILNQSETRFTFFVVVDDPSNNVLIDLLKKYQHRDDRLQVLINEQNLGLAESLNRGIAAGNAPYIARMDADDIAFEDRLSTQLNYLQAHPHIGLIGSAIENIDESDNSLGTKTFESDSFLLEKMIPYISVACHPTWMFRRSCYEAVDGYRNLSTAQDYDFLYRLLDAGIQITNLPCVLVKYRIHNSSITSGMSLKRYKIRQYIHKLHKDRVQSGTDHFDEVELSSYIAQARSSNTVSSLLTGLRKAEEQQSSSRYFYLIMLMFFSSDVRKRITDHLKLKWVIMHHKSKSNA